jgi:ribosome-binding protein aMBF1 (putative translation factor)
MPNPPTPEQIKEARLTAGLTRLQLAGLLLDCTPEQIDLARRLISLDYQIRQWETGAHTPDRTHASRLRHTLALDQDT